MFCNTSLLQEATIRVQSTLMIDTILPVEMQVLFDPKLHLRLRHLGRTMAVLTAVIVFVTADTGMLILRTILLTVIGISAEELMITRTAK